MHSARISSRSRALCAPRPHAAVGDVRAAAARLAGAAACVVLSAAMTLACAKAPKEDEPPAKASNASASSKGKAKTATRPTLPPEPSPPVADRASEVPKLEAKLADDAVYSAIWTAPRSDLDLLLTHLSELIAEGGASLDIANPSKAKKTEPAAITLFLIFSRVGHFPDNFTSKLRAHLTSVRGEAHLGVWSPWKKGDAPRDYSALAAWLVPDDAAYLRERIRAKGAGPTRWTTRGSDKVARPWLVFYPEALERLALLTSVTAADCEPAGMEVFEPIDEETGESGRRGCQPSKPASLKDAHRARLVVGGNFGKRWSSKPERVDGDWPFKVDFGWVECVPVEPPGVDKPVEAVVFRTATANYALNGFARSWKLGDEVDPIWLTNPTAPALKVSVAGVIAFGLKLCAE
jgi:hypothetical protein